MTEQAGTTGNDQDGHPDGVPVPRSSVPPEPPVSIDAGLNEVLWRSRELGFLGQGGVEAHVANARAFVVSLGPPANGTSTGPSRLLDLGSGGGVPGLVLAVERPDLDLVLLDAGRRRVEFLEEAVLELGLGRRVCVVHGRAEELARDPELRGRMDVVTARSFAPPAVTAECAVGFLTGPGAFALVSEPPDGSTERWSVEGLAELGLRPARRDVLDGTTIQRLDVTESCPDRYPRRVGIPAKRPLFR